jgi:DNA-directed RNA polymerase specialized sigma24 family protein
MSPEGSVTHWISLLQAGDRAAAAPLWERFFQQLVDLARKRLRGAPRLPADEEDVALSAFASFCRAAERGCYPDLNGRDSLWRLLVVVTDRKAKRLIKYHCRVKRGGGHILDEHALAAEGAGLDGRPGSTATPDFVAEMAEECCRLLDRLGEAELRTIALWKLEGYTNEEIAEKLDCVPRTVERKLARIRNVWDKDPHDE